MPQGRRKIPFSGKAKKVQMQMKRERKEEDEPHGFEDREKTSGKLPKLLLTFFFINYKTS